MKDKQELALAQQTQGGELVDAAQIGGMLNQMMGLMQGMAETLLATNERVAVLEKQSALNARVTPAQAKQINAAYPNSNGCASLAWGGTVRQRRRPMRC